MLDELNLVELGVFFPQQHMDNRVKEMQEEKTQVEEKYRDIQCKFKNTKRCRASSMTLRRKKMKACK